MTQLSEKPYLDLRLKPHFSSTGAASSLTATLKIEEPHKRPGQPLFTFVTFYGNVPSHPYTADQITARDDTGPLSISREPSKDGDKNVQEWHIARATDGDVVVELQVFPREVDLTTPLGARVDLRKDQGGLIGAGQWFLPRPALEAPKCVSSVEWDLSEAPAGTRAIWSFGEGPDKITKEGRLDVLFSAMYMVGPVQSYPSDGERGQVMEDEEKQLNLESAGDRVREKDDQVPYSWFYWFGTLPDNLFKMRSFNNNLFIKMSAFFDDPAGPENTYRTFVRKCPRGLGGTGFLASYTLEYDEQSAESMTEWAFVGLLTHEMVHSWAILDDEDDGYDNYWYEEGIAQLYSIFFPFRFGFYPPAYFKHTLNSLLSAYYTSPRINMPLRDAQRAFFDDFYAEQLPYMRGNAYLLKLDYTLRMAARERQTAAERAQATHDVRVLDSIVVDLARRRARGERLLQKDFLEYLYKWLPKEEVDQEFQNMLAGKTLDLTEVAMFGAKHHLINEPQEMLEFGFDKKSLNARIMSGVVPGSRAALAGLRDGDKLIRTSSISQCMDDFETKLTLVVERDGEEVAIEYWPRAFVKVDCLQLREKQQT